MLRRNSLTALAASFIFGSALGVCLIFGSVCTAAQVVLASDATLGKPVDGIAGTPMKIEQFGKPLDLIKKESGKIKLKNLQVFLSDEVRNREIVVVSITGAFRTGKSFFLNYCLRYMYGNYKSVNNPKDPFKFGFPGAFDSLITENRKSVDYVFSSEEHFDENQETEPLAGFEWKSGTNRVSSGIKIWSDVFLHGNDTAIVLVDFEDILDGSKAFSPKTLALSTLISSIQIINLDQTISDDISEPLKMITDVQKKMTNANWDYKNGKVFQNMMFLVRDFNTMGYRVGRHDGSRYVTNILKRKAFQTIQSHFDDSFETISGFLMPPPGDSVLSDSYDGSLKPMESTFRAELGNALDLLLSKRNLEVKHFNGEKLKSHELVQYIKRYSEAFFTNPTVHPTAEALAKITVEENLKVFSSRIAEKYEKRFDEIILRTSADLDPKVIIEKEAALRALALVKLDREKAKYDSKHLPTDALENLIKKLDEIRTQKVNPLTS